MDPTTIWCGYGAQFGGTIVIGIDCLVGTLYNVGDPTDKVRYCEVQSQGVTIGAGLGGGVGIMFLLALGFASPQELNGWASVDVDFAFDLGIKGLGKYLESLYEVGKAGKIMKYWGKGVTFLEDYSKTKDFTFNAIKNRDLVVDPHKQQFIAWPIPTPIPTSLQVSLGKRASEVDVTSWGTVDLRNELRKLSGKTVPT
jgi:hypothetical protein